MIRPPITSIDISQNDLNFHLQQLDIYQGLVKQGFKQKEIIRYFKEKDAPSRERSRFETSCQGPMLSTHELGPTPSQFAASTAVGTTVASDPEVGGAEFLASPDYKIEALDISANRSYRTHAPRQSSLLRFARGASSETSSEDENTVTIPFSPRPSLTYRPRSQTYSCDQSEPDSEYLTSEHKATAPELEHLSLDDELVPTNADSSRKTTRVVSDLHPETEVFTALHQRLVQNASSPNGQEKWSSSLGSDHKSFPSSPPVLPSSPSAFRRPRSPSLPPMPKTPQTCYFEHSETSHPRARQAFLDGSFTVYDDSVPAEIQPQTPADLQRDIHFTESNAACPAPPGVLRSPIQLDNGRLAGDDSPPTACTRSRERREREDTRSARIEGLEVGTQSRYGSDTSQRSTRTKYRHVARRPRC